MRKGQPFNSWERLLATVAALFVLAIGFHALTTREMTDRAGHPLPESTAFGMGGMLVIVGAGLLVAVLMAD